MRPPGSLSPAPSAVHSTPARAAHCPPGQAALGPRPDSTRWTGTVGPSGSRASAGPGGPSSQRTFLGGEVGMAGRQTARPVLGNRHQPLVGSLLRNGAALSPEGLLPPQAELTLSHGSRWGAALLVPRKAAETKQVALAGTLSVSPTQIPEPRDQPWQAAKPQQGLASPLRFPT